MKTQWVVHASSHLRCRPIMCTRFPRILLSANHQPPPLTRCRPWCISVRAAATLCVPVARACSNTSHDGVCIDSGQVGWHERCGVVGVASPTAGITRGGRQPSCPTPRPGPASSGRCQRRLQRGRSGAGPLGTGRAPAAVACCHRAHVARVTMMRGWGAGVLCGGRSVVPVAQLQDAVIESLLQLK